MMSLLPLLFSAWWADLDRPHRLWDQNIGMGMMPEQLLLPSPVERCPTMNNRAALELFLRPMAEHLMRQGTTGTSTITADKDMFKVMLDVQQFKPEEITLKIVDRFVVVTAKHEEKRDEHGLISRQFMRKYLLPQQVDEDQLTSNISSDGVLTIMAPLKAKEETQNEKIIKIEMTGKPAIRTDTTTERTTATMENERPASTEESTERLEDATENTTTKEKSEK